MEKKLYRDDYNKSIGGVCLGLAEYFSIDVSIVRTVFVVAGLIKGFGVPLYIILWCILPKKPYNAYNVNVDYTVPPTGPSFTPPVFTQPKKTSTFAAVFGALMVVVGTIFLLDNFDILPEIDFDYIWPLMIIGVGIAIIFSGKKKQPWDQPNWEKKDTFKEEIKDFKTEEGTTTNDQNTTI